jgi:hypothetical protein
MHDTITGVDLAKNEIQVCITKANHGGIILKGISRNF